MQQYARYTTKKIADNKSLKGIAFEDVAIHIPQFSHLETYKKTIRQYESNWICKKDLISFVSKIGMKKYF